jgi:Flp pilus assembly protein TadG
MRIPGRPLAQSFATDDRGVALVEMTLIVPFMLVLAAGVFEFSNLLHTRLLIEAGVEDAARYIARCSDVLATCESRALNLAVTGEVSGGTSRVTGWTTADVQIGPYGTFAAVDEEGNLQYRSSTSDVHVVHVSATYAYTGTGLWAFLGFGAISLTAFHEERLIGW